MLQLCNLGWPNLKNNRPSDLYEYCANEVLKYEKKLALSRKRDLEARLKLREEIKRLQHQDPTNPKLQMMQAQWIKSVQHKRLAGLPGTFLPPFGFVAQGEADFFNQKAAKAEGLGPVLDIVPSESVSGFYGVDTVFQTTQNQSPMMEVVDEEEEEADKREMLEIERRLNNIDLSEAESQQMTSRIATLYKKLTG